MAHVKAGFAADFGNTERWDPRASQTVRVTFSRPFSSKPEVVVALASLHFAIAPPQGVVSCGVKATNITENGFEIAATEDVPVKGLTNISASWFAFGH